MNDLWRTYPVTCVWLALSALMLVLMLVDGWA